MKKIRFLPIRREDITTALSMCDRCFAVVLDGNEQSHANWHEGTTGPRYSPDGGLRPQDAPFETDDEALARLRAAIRQPQEPTPKRRTGEQ